MLAKTNIELKSDNRDNRIYFQFIEAVHRNQQARRRNIDRHSGREVNQSEAE
jgi:hypothetical protein